MYWLDELNAVDVRHPQHDGCGQKLCSPCRMGFEEAEQARPLQHLGEPGLIVTYQPTIEHPCADTLESKQVTFPYCDFSKLGCYFPMISRESALFSRSCKPIYLWIVPCQGAARRHCLRQHGMCPGLWLPKGYQVEIVGSKAIDSYAFSWGVPLKLQDQSPEEHNGKVRQEREGDHLAGRKLGLGTLGTAVISWSTWQKSAIIKSSVVMALPPAC